MIKTTAIERRMQKHGYVLCFHCNQSVLPMEVRHSYNPDCENKHRAGELGLEPRSFISKHSGQSVNGICFPKDADRNLVRFSKAAGGTIQKMDFSS